MKVFQVEDHRITFRLGKNESFRSLQDINENDILSIVSMIIDGKDIEMDLVPEDEIGRNPAELIIYKELYSQFEKIINERDEILRRIDDEFADARSYYEGEELKNDLLKFGQL